MGGITVLGGHNSTTKGTSQTRFKTLSEHGLEADAITGLPQCKTR